MAVTSSGRDQAGKYIDSQITAQAAAVTAASGHDKERKTELLLQTRMEAVIHYMRIGRIDPATVLSTLT